METINSILAKLRNSYSAKNIESDKKLAKLENWLLKQKKNNSGNDPITIKSDVINSLIHKYLS